MDDLNRKLLELFQLSDGLLLPDEAALEEISNKQRELRAWNEDIVFQGLFTIREILQDLANQNEVGPVNPMDEMNRSLSERLQNGFLERNQTLPTVWELTRHLSNWTRVLIPPIRTLDISGDMKLVSCLESTDHYLPALAAIILGYKEFNYVGGIEKFSGMLNSTYQTSLRLEIGRLIYTRYHNPQVLRTDVVPNLVANENQYDTTLEDDIQRKRFFSYIRELVVWDIATKGGGPRKKWATWWM